MPAAPRSSQSGQVVVIFAGAMLLFILLSATVIDLSWYWTNNLRMQRAADAAALAGVVFLPGDPTTAYSVARAEAAKNGFTDGTAGFVVTPVQDPTDDHRLRVAISGPINTFFARVAGIQSWPARRDAKADFVLPVPMGSPENYYGVFGLLRHPGGGVTTTNTTSGNTAWMDPTTVPGGNWTNPTNAYLEQSPDRKSLRPRTAPRTRSSSGAATTSRYPAARSRSTGSKSMPRCDRPMRQAAACRPPSTGPGRRTRPAPA
jgi:putative Flp pilus-assembly TadE/G-like protein